MITLQAEYVDLPFRLIRQFPLLAGFGHPAVDKTLKSTNQLTD